MEIPRRYVSLVAIVTQTDIAAFLGAAALEALRASSCQHRLDTLDVLDGDQEQDFVLSALAALLRITSMVGGHAWLRLTAALAAFVSPAADQPTASHLRVPRTPPAVSRYPLPRPPRPR